MEEPLRVPLDDLETSPENPWYDAVYQGRPFTGIAWDEWNGRYSETAYVDGVAHGRSFERFESGLLASDELVDHGQLTEGTFWWPPGETVRRRKTAEAEGRTLRGENGGASAAVLSLRRDAGGDAVRSGGGGADLLGPGRDMDGPRAVPLCI